MCLHSPRSNEQVIKMKRFSLLFCFGSLLLGAVAGTNAHHGGGSYWDRSRQPVGPVTGIATEFLFTFPHVSIFMDIAHEGADAENYLMSIVWTPTILRELGWTRRSIQPGDELTVTYSPHKRDARSGSLVSIEVNGVPMNMDYN